MRRARELHDRATLAITPIALVIAQVPDVKPNASKAPGGKGLEDAINVFAFYGILACVAGFLLGGTVWAVGGRTGNEYAANGGKVGMGVAVWRRVPDRCVLGDHQLRLRRRRHLRCTSADGESSQASSSPSSSSAPSAGRSAGSTAADTAEADGGGQGEGEAIRFVDGVPVGTQAHPGGCPDRGGQLRHDGD